MDEKLPVRAEEGRANLISQFIEAFVDEVLLFIECSEEDGTSFKIKESDLIDANGEDLILLVYEDGRGFGCFWGAEEVFECLIA